MRPGGYEIMTGPVGVILERDTQTCAHCNSVVRIPLRAHPNFFSICKKCMKFVCEKCSAYTCDPVEKKLERAEKEYRASLLSR